LNITYLRSLYKSAGERWIRNRCTIKRVKRKRISFISTKIDRQIRSVPHLYVKRRSASITKDFQEKKRKKRSDV